ncbi:MAG: hypothetical protein NVSMB9_24490 [Isosphaeraceae bacterium]
MVGEFAQAARVPLPDMSRRDSEKFPNRTRAAISFHNRPHPPRCAFEARGGSLQPEMARGISPDVR